MHTLVVGWSSVLHGEATAGDVLAMDAVADALGAAGIPHDVAWSAVMCPPGGLRLDDADPRRYTDLVFVCGPATGRSIAELHERFAHCRRIAVGVSVLDPGDPVTAGFHRVIARDRPGAGAHRDLAARPVPQAVPVLGVYLTSGQQEYGARRRHETTRAGLEAWLGGLDAARLPLETRLDPRDWRLPATAAQVGSVIARLDAVVTMRMHGLVLALRAGVPVLAVDPVAGGGKVTAQARAWDWPAVVGPEELGAGRLEEQLHWCLSAEGRKAAQARSAKDPSGTEQLHDLVRELGGTPRPDPAGRLGAEASEGLLESAGTPAHQR
ncbi:polysaccharide pyruvyl transferase family protein [Kocuria sediminis]|uniref:Polysaccharide pyruvyl transferase family protein n=1 Tax=Kocuria sediminis TaxID=1038857 RepID=A0A6N8GNK1_9MICC|nr:polysaccharide pyruvyl transferase family protein [Kocuria sediminis]MUN63870.1 polysaccharide pyruvyl transferase family protein [Kocuria sediminis]